MRFSWRDFHFAWMIENALFLKLIIVKGSDLAKMIIYKLYHLHASQHLSIWKTHCKISWIFASHWSDLKEKDWSTSEIY